MNKNRTTVNDDNISGEIKTTYSDMHIWTHLLRIHSIIQTVILTNYRIRVKCINYNYDYYDYSEKIISFRNCWSLDWCLIFHRRNFKLRDSAKIFKFPTIVKVENCFFFLWISVLIRSNDTRFVDCF